MTNRKKQAEGRIEKARRLRKGASHLRTRTAGSSDRVSNPATVMENSQRWRPCNVGSKMPAAPSTRTRGRHAVARPSLLGPLAVASTAVLAVVGPVAPASPLHLWVAAEETADVLAGEPGVLVCQHDTCRALLPATPDSPMRCLRLCESRGDAVPRGASRTRSPCGLSWSSGARPAHA